MDKFRKPNFLEAEDTGKPKDQFEAILDKEFKLAKSHDPNASFEQVFGLTARKFPELYQLHLHKVAGDPNVLTYTEPSPYFRKVSSLYFSELRKLDPDASYAQAAATCATFYPALYESHLSEKLGVTIHQPKVQLSDRQRTIIPAGDGVVLDRFKFARKAFPQLTQDRLSELKQDDKAARYEVALSQTAARFVEMYADYQIAVGS